MEQRRAVIPVKHNVTFVKSSPEEMAYDPSPEETADWMPVGRGPGAVFSKPSKELAALWTKKLATARQGYVRLDPDLRAKFKGDAEVNKALRDWLDSLSSTKRNRRRSA